jgi:hypothetical protein
VLAALAQLLASPHRSSRSSLGALLLTCRFHHLAELLLQLADLVAEPGRDLELELRAAAFIWSVRSWISWARSAEGSPARSAAWAPTSDSRSRGTGWPPWPSPHRRALGLGAGPGLQQRLGGLVLAGQHLGDVGDLLAQRCRVDAVGLVEGDLLVAAPVGLVDRGLHRGRDLVGVHVHLAGDVAGGAADRLDQRLVGAQEPLLVGVEDRDQRDLGQVEALASRFDADEDVVLPSELAQQLDARRVSTSDVQVAGAMPSRGG